MQHWVELKGRCYLHVHTQYASSLRTSNLWREIAGCACVQIVETVDLGLRIGQAKTITSTCGHVSEKTMSGFVQHGSEGERNSTKVQLVKGST